MNHKPWLPTGKLSDGTLLFGPLKERPSDFGAITEVAVDGTTWFVAHSGDSISSAMRSELDSWARQRVADYANKKTS